MLRRGKSVVTERAFKLAACLVIHASVSKAGDDQTKRQLVQPMLMSVTINGRTARWILRSCASTRPGRLSVGRVLTDILEVASHA